MEFERSIKKEIADVKEKLFLGEVISSVDGNRYYIDLDGRHPLPDEETARFLKTNKGIIQLSVDEIKTYPLAKTIDSVKKAPLKIWEKTHVYVILNEKKYHVNSASFLADWDRKDYAEISTQELQRIPTGK